MHVSAKTARRQAGFTLIELMMALLVSGIVLLGIFAFSSIQQSNAAVHRSRVRVQQALEGAMWSMGRDVRSAGLGFSRLCTELRVYDPVSGRLINPGAVAQPNQAFTDAVTTEPYWALRDGIQAHWRSNIGGQTIEGDLATSAAVNSAADSFDVILGEGGQTHSLGLFTLDISPPATGGAAALQVRTAAAGPYQLDSGNGQHLDWMRQLVPPGSFVIIARGAGLNSEGVAYRPEARGQCALVQVTADLQQGPGTNLWQIPIANNSGFNQNLETLFDPLLPADAGGANSDWIETEDFSAGAIVVPLGQLRWSRYEIDYTVPSRPYLIRTDIIGPAENDPQVAAASNYPSCNGATCTLPQLHLPTGQDVTTLPQVAIAPMIEDMQVAVGCDGYDADSQFMLTSVDAPAPPDIAGGTDYQERGDENTNLPNRMVDEWVNNRGSDEWLGNARDEAWAADCVYYGTGQERADLWANAGPGFESGGGPGFRMSPQTIRVTLVGKSEVIGGNSDASFNDFDIYNTLFPIEDRPQLDTVVGNREYLTLTERFSPKNARWRDPAMP